MAFIEVRNLRKTYSNSDHNVEILKGITIDIARGEFVSLMGPSGAGKSTFLQLLGALDKPTSGEVIIDDKKINLMEDKDLTIFRRRNLGFIFQFFNLMPTLTVLENVALPCFLDGDKLSKVRKPAEEILGRLGLSHRLDHKPFQLSGGEMQRVAIARALMNKPSLILADEPTGNLDSKNTQEVLRILKGLARESNVTLIMVTHDKSAADYADRQIFMKDGLVT